MHKILFALCLALLFCGCSTTKRARSVETSDFLADVASKLHKGGDKEPLLCYRNTNANWAAYTNILLDPVMLWQKPDSGNTTPKADLQRLVDNFHLILYTNFVAAGYGMVNSPQPHTLRIQVAVTSMEQTWTAPSVISKVVPQVRMLDTVQGFISGKPVFAGEASIEAKVLDAETGELLAAGADRRVGGKTLNAQAFNSWGDAIQISEFWGKGFVYRLKIARAGANDTSSITLDGHH
jgi:hypothetical protein